ncbi:hypothetical protein FRB96_005131 [Tulasnella sp. 330]|nr:hypothetical protein FRB96_005131 [Tulasnella sp. 330]KAG8887270.1 hypothetical protein FRB98_000307 [Tulasnella sp. 332]
MALDESTTSILGYSLYDELTNTSIQPTDDPASSDLIDFLLKAVGQDVCAATRNTQGLYRFVSRARDICKAIKIMIDRVESVVDSNPLEALEAFQKYTQMIPSLEDELLRVASLVPGEAIDLSKPLVPTTPTTVTELSKPVDDWRENRRVIRDALRQLYSPPFVADGVPPSANMITVFTKHDDLAWLSHVTHCISTHSLAQGEDELPTSIRRLAATYEDILTSLRTQVFLSEKTLVLIIRSGMTMFTVIGMIDTTKDRELKRRLKQPEDTWGRAQRLLGQMLDRVKTPDPEVQIPEANGSTDILQDNWMDFEAYLLETSHVNLVPKVIELWSYVSNMRRHYQAQEAALVSLCIDLERGLLDDATSRDVYQLEE